MYIIMNRVTKLFLIGLIGTSVLTACTKATNDGSTQGSDASKLFRALLRGKIFSTGHVKIVNEAGQGISGAKVLIGTGLNTPFQKNFLITDNEGSFLVPKEWESPQAVTISAPGYMRTTFMGQLPKDHTFVLRQAESTTRYELTGTTPGINVTNGDGVADFSFVMPALQKQDLMNFNIGMVISSENDMISVAGTDVAIPSNVTLPKQRENYFIPITINKPDFRIYFNSPSTKKVFAARGQFPFKKVVGEMRDGAPFVDLINYFTIQSGGLRDAGVTAGTQKMDIPVNELQFTEKRSVVNETISADDVLLGVSLGELQGYMIPTDVKNMDSGGTNSFSLLANSSSQFLSVIKHKSEIIPVGPGVGRSSAVVVPFTEGLAVKHLPVIENPRVMSAYVVQLPHVDSMNLKQVITCATLALVRTNTQGKKVTEITTVLWEVYGTGWSPTIEIPNWPEEPVLSGKLRWYVTLAGGKADSDPNLDLGPGLMQTVTHVTSSAADL